MRRTYATLLQRFKGGEAVVDSRGAFSVLALRRFESWLQALEEAARLQAGSGVLQVEASEALVTGNLVSLHNATGLKARKANATTVGKPAHGYVLADYAIGEETTVFVSGLNDKVTGLSPGEAYLATTAGGVVSAAPAGVGNAIQHVGLAISATELLFDARAALFDSLTNGDLHGVTGNAVFDALALKQPLDADLTAIALLTTTAFGRDLLTMANAGATRTVLGLDDNDSVVFGQVTAGAQPPTAGQMQAVGAAGGVALALSDNANASLYVRTASGGAIIGTDDFAALYLAAGGNGTGNRQLGIVATAVADETPALLLINGSFKRVSQGAADSAGAGFRTLRVPN